MVLRFDERSITTIGVLLGVVFRIGVLTEFMNVPAESTGWKIFGGILGVRRARCDLGVHAARGVLAFWASQQLVTAKADLPIFYVGIMAMSRVVSQIVFAFGVRSLGHDC